jgi:radical SAM superfamily enzyme YgiQ (UPF0313 family)
MRVLLVNTAGGYGGAEGLWNCTIPLTLPYLAGLTPPDVQVTLRHLGRDRIDDDYGRHYDLVGVSTLTDQRKMAFQVADTFRERGRTVVMGGIDPTIRPDEAAAHCESVVAGEAETIWPKVVRDVENKDLKPLYREEGLPDLKGIPPPRYDLLGGGPEAAKIYYPVLTSKGCPNRCEFCFIPELFGGRLRTRPVEDVLRDIESVVEQTNSRKIAFVDDNIIGARKHAKELFKAMIPLRVQWSGECTLDIADDPELLELATKSGCVQLSVGMESINADSLLEIGKRCNLVERYPDQIRKIQSRKILLVTNMMVGFDHDSRESLRRTPEHLIRWKVHFIAPFILRPLVGTRLFKRLEQEGRLLPEATRDDTRTDLATYVPKQMSPEELEQLFRNLSRRFYSLPSIARRLFVRPSPVFFKVLTLNLLVNLKLIQLPRIRRIPGLQRAFSLLKSSRKSRILSRAT